VTTYIPTEILEKNQEPSISRENMRQKSQNRISFERQIIIEGETEF
jgi:hypothetical protein